MIAKLICLFKGHRTFSYVYHSEYPTEHAYWCGRCGYESSEEQDRREYREQLEMVFLQRYYPYGRYM